MSHLPPLSSNQTPAEIKYEGAERPPSWHRLGPLHVPLEAQRCRHGTVAIPIVAIACLVAVRPRQQCPQPQQPDFTDNQPVVGSRVRQPVDRLLGFGQVALGAALQQPFGGNEFDSREVRKILLRPRNAGIALHEGKPVGEGAWDKILDADTFAAAEAVLADPTRRQIIASTSGIQTNTFATSPPVTLPKPLTKLETNGYDPAAFVLHPNGWEAVELLVASTNAVEHMSRTTPSPGASTVCRSWLRTRPPKASHTRWRKALPGSTPTAEASRWTGRRPATATTGQRT